MPKIPNASSESRRARCAVALEIASNHRCRAADDRRCDAHCRIGGYDRRIEPALGSRTNAHRDLLRIRRTDEIDHRRIDGRRGRRKVGPPRREAAVKEQPNCRRDVGSRP